MRQKYKSPCGAVEAGEEITLRVQCRRRDLARPTLILWKDAQPERRLEMEWIAVEGNMDWYETKFILEEAGLYWYLFELETEAGTVRIGKNEGGHPWQQTVYLPQFTTPEWIRGGVIYHIFVDRFFHEGEAVEKPGALLRDDWGGMPQFRPNEEGKVLNRDFFGGNLKGILHKLDYLQSLGVTAIYLSPIFEAHSNHKYDTGDYRKIDPMFGTEKDLRTLAQEAEKRGIRLICDGVFNHTGDDSLYFNKYGHYPEIGAYQSQQSKYYSWYQFRSWPEEYESWWGIDILPAIDKTAPSFREFIQGKDGILRHWMKQGVSSWRLDVADELSDEFLDGLRRTVKEENPQALIIGEVWEDASNKEAYGKRRRYLQGEQLDSVMNYPVRSGMIEFIKNANVQPLVQTMEQIWENYPKCVIHDLMNVLGTHDTERILTLLGAQCYPHDKEEMAVMKLSPKEYQKGRQLLKLASLLEFTLPGVPCIYYGDEAGMQGWKDPFNRVCYPWGKEDAQLMLWYRELGAFRRKNPVFANGQYRCLYGDRGAYVFSRYDEQQEIIIAVNRGEEPLELITEEKRILLKRDTYGIVENCGGKTKRIFLDE